MAENAGEAGAFYAGSDGETATPQRYESLVNAVGDGICQFGADGSVVGVNDAFAALAGRSRAELLESHVSAVFAAGDAARIEAAMDGLRETGAGDAASIEVAVETADGGPVPCELRLSGVDAGERSGGAVGVVRELSRPSDAERVVEQRRADGELRESWRRFDSFVDAVEEYAIFMLDPDGCVVTWNEGASRLKGYEESEIVGEHFSTFYTDEDRAADVPARNLDRALSDGSVEDEGWRVRADGGRFWANVTITAIRDDDGRLQGFAKVTRDMTDRRERERDLRRERDLNERVLEAVPESILLVDDGDGRVVRANDRAQDRLDFDPAEEEYLVGDVDVYDESGEWAPPADRPYLRAFESGEAVSDWHCRIEFPGEGQRWTSINAVPVYDDGEVSNVVVTASDITQLKEQSRRLERRREELEAELDEVFDRVTDAFFALDDEWRFTHVNDRAEAVLGRTSGELVGETIWNEFEPALGTKFEREFERAMERQESVSFEEYFPPLETWFEVRAYPSETGLSVYFRDVTERKERERDLKRYETLFTESRDVNAVMAPDGTFQYLTPSAEYVLGYDPETLVGENAFEYVHPEDRERAAEEYATMLEDPGYEPSVEFRFKHADGSWVVIEARARNLLDEEKIEGLVVYTRDVTERKERERALAERENELERYKQYTDDVLDTVDDVLYVLDENGVLRRWNESLSEVTGYSDDEVVSMGALDFFEPSEHERIATAISDGFETGHTRVEADLATSDGEQIPYEFVASTLENPDGERMLAGIGRDVSRQKERERELEQYQQIFETVRDGVYVVDANGTFVDVNRAYCEMTGYDESELLGEHVSMVVDEETIERASEIEALLFGRERTNAQLTADVLTASGERVTAEASFSVLETDDARHRIGVVRDMTDWKERERQLERQREQLAALNQLNGVVREITDAVIEQSTREEIERTVCEALADADSYEFAWVGELDTASESVTLRTEAGVEGYLDELTLPADPEDPMGRGPTATAVRTGETQVIGDAYEDYDAEEWREQAAEYGFRSSAAIPIVHEGTTYDVLNVYAARPNAFAGEERDVVGQLGEIVGHAIAAVERKRALMSDEVIEVEFRIEDVLDAFGVSATTDGRIALEETIPLDGGNYLVYGTATDADAVAVIEELVDVVPSWTDVRVLGEDLERVRFELHLSEPPVLSAVASRGGLVADAWIEDGDYQMTIQVPHGVEIRQIVDTVADAYPAAELRAQRQVTRTEDDATRVVSAFEEQLTDRQRTVLETAYHGGYFEWPRDSSGEDVADRLGIAPATLSQHLRTAENRIFGALLESDAAT